MIGPVPVHEISRGPPPLRPRAVAGLPWVIFVRGGGRGPHTEFGTTDTLGGVRGTHQSRLKPLNAHLPIDFARSRFFSPFARADLHRVTRVRASSDVTCSAQSRQEESKEPRQLSANGQQRFLG